MDVTFIYTQGCALSWAISVLTLNAAQPVSVVSCHVLYREESAASVMVSSEGK